MLLLANGQETLRPKPIFESHDILEFKLLCNFVELVSDVGDERRKHDAWLIHKDTANKVKIEMELKTRGNFRRNPMNCNFPPIKLDFDGERKKTVFEGLGKVKLVTHCQDTIGEYEENVLKEYLVYRLYNHITPFSFNVRLCRIKYKTPWSFHVNKKYAFIIEDNDDLAKRMHGKKLNELDEYIPIDSLSIAVLSFFEFMIGNTDWVLVPLQNMEVVRLKNGKNIAIPYDFDLSAFVNASYAQQALFADSLEFHTSAYKGPKLSKKIIDEAIKLFEANKYAMLHEIIERKEIRASERKRLISYLNRFYARIERNPYDPEWYDNND